MPLAVKQGAFSFQYIFVMSFFLNRLTPKTNLKRSVIKL